MRTNKLGNVKTFRRFALVILLSWFGLYMYFFQNASPKNPLELTIEGHEYSDQKLVEESCFHFTRRYLDERVYLKMKSLQFLSCSNDVGFIKMRVHSESQGFGVQFVSYYAALSYSLSQNKTFYLDGAVWNYAPSATSPFCGNRKGFECFFRATSSCTLDKNIEELSQDQGVMLGRANTYLNEMGELAFILHHDMLNPPEYVKKEKGSGAARWWEGQMATALFCPRQEVLDIVNKAKEWLGWQEPIIGMHVRHTDRKDLLIYDLKDYMKEALALQEKHNVNFIYLATDDPEIVSQANQWKHKFTFLHLTNFSTPFDNNGKTKDYKFSSDTSVETTLRMLIDLHLLSDSNFFIGAQRSMFSWLASRLQLGRGNDLDCPRWIAGDTTNHYGYWNGTKMDDQLCI